MKILNLFFLLALISSAHAADLTNASKITCSGTCSKSSTMEGVCSAEIVKNDDGTYTVNDDIDGGKNRSESPKLELNNIPLIAVLGDCKGAKTNIDLQTGTGTFEYKYQSGIEGGGCQTGASDVATCTASK